MVEKFEKFAVVKSLADLERVDFDFAKGLKNSIIFDTNFLFVTFEFRVDIIEELKRVVGSEYNLFIYEGTIDELVAIEEKKNKNKKFLPLIAKMLYLYGFKVIRSEISYIDGQILNNLDNRVIIATNDKELRKKIWEKNSRVLYLRQKSYLEIK